MRRAEQDCTRLRREGRHDSVAAAQSVTGSHAVSTRVATPAVQADGLLLLGGAFIFLANAAAGSLPVRFTPLAATKTTFTGNRHRPLQHVAAIAVQAGQTILVGNSSRPSATTLNRLARIARLRPRLSRRLGRCLPGRPHREDRGFEIGQVGYPSRGQLRREKGRHAPKLVVGPRRHQLARLFVLVHLVTPVS